MGMIPNFLSPQRNWCSPSSSPRIPIQHSQYRDMSTDLIGMLIEVFDNNLDPSHDTSLSIFFSKSTSSDVSKLLSKAISPSAYFSQTEPSLPRQFPLLPSPSQNSIIVAKVNTNKPRICRNTKVKFNRHHVAVGDFHPSRGKIVIAGKRPTFTIPVLVLIGWVVNVTTNEAHVIGLSSSSSSSASSLKSSMATMPVGSDLDIINGAPAPAKWTDNVERENLV